MVFFRQLVPLGLLLLSGCSSTGLSTFDTLHYATLGSDDVQVTAEQVQRVPYASAYLRVGDNPQALVVLAFADPDGTLTWVSADENIFITRHGRFIKTVGLKNDLYSLNSEQADPLSKLTKQVSAISSASDLVLQSWLYQGEWSRDYLSGYNCTSHIISAHNDTLIVLDKKYPVLLVTERIDMALNSTGWNNYYWVDRNSGRVIKTAQKLGPDMPVIEMTILKPYNS